MHLPPEQGHYLRNVLRMKEGDSLHLFNAHHGEWEARILRLHKQDAALEIVSQHRAPEVEPDVWLLFAPIKSGRIDTLVEKATELGASRLIPVMTQYTNMGKVNTGRLRHIATEAAEQCERLSVPDIPDAVPLATALAGLPEDRFLLWADEAGSGGSVYEVLASQPAERRWAALVGPEGGFSPEERDYLRAHPRIVPASLGPRILRADTAAMALLTALHSRFGDWDRMPRT